MHRRTCPVLYHICAGILVATLPACSDQADVAPSAPTREELRNVLTGDAATRVAPDGSFNLSSRLHTDSELSESQARSLATAYLRQAGPMIRRSLEKQRGSSIKLDALRQCGRGLYAASPFEVLGPEIHGAYRRVFGSWWLVGFCGSGGGLEVSVAVSALAIELTVKDDRVDFGSSSGTEFFTMGVPPEWDGPAGLSPERAAVRIGNKTGKRITQVPELIAPHPKLAYPQGAVWRLRLEGPVRARGNKTGRASTTTEVFAGLNQDVGYKAHAVGEEEQILRIPTADQPAELTFTYRYSRNGRTPSDPPVTESGVLRRRSDRPVFLETATIEEP
jgi:hypothetical protein